MDVVEKKKQQDGAADTPKTVEAELRAVFEDAFDAEARQIEAELADFTLQMDEEQKVRMKAKVMARFVAAEEAKKAQNTEKAAAAENTVADAVAEKEEEKSSGPEEIVAETKGTAAEAGKPGKPARIHLYRRIAVAAAVFCVAVLGLTVQSQAGKDGIWRSIQRLIGSDSRWEQKNNGDRREYSDPEELKVIRNIEDTLEIILPEFFYWPEEMKFLDGEVIESSESFTMTYEESGNTVYFQGWKNDGDLSDINLLQDNENVIYENYEGIEYTIIETSTDNFRYPVLYSAEWSVNNHKFLLSNIDDVTKMKRILKNIKN